MRDTLESIGLVLVMIGGAMAAFTLVLICQPFFWLTVIAVTLIIYLV